MKLLELQAAIDRELAARRDAGQVLAHRHRTEAVAADAAGDRAAAKSLRLLAVLAEKDAALAEAERRDRAVRYAKYVKAVQARGAAAAKRPGRQHPVIARVEGMFADERAAGVEFKVLLRRWEREPLDGLRLVVVDDENVRIVDEDAAPTGADKRSAEPVVRKLKTLQKLYYSDTAAR
jgi:hypothetical protein